MHTRMEHQHHLLKLVVDVIVCGTLKQTWSSRLKSWSRNPPRAQNTNNLNRSLRERRRKSEMVNEQAHWIEKATRWENKESPSLRLALNKNKLWSTFMNKCNLILKGQSQLNRSLNRRKESLRISIVVQVNVASRRIPSLLNPWLLTRKSSWKSWRR